MFSILLYTINMFRGNVCVCVYVCDASLYKRLFQLGSRGLFMVVFVFASAAFITIKFNRLFYRYDDLFI